MDEVEALVDRIDRVFVDCGGVLHSRDAERERREAELADLSTDEFSVLSREIFTKVVAAREKLKKRNELLRKDPTDPALVIVSQHLRLAIKDVEAGADAMEAMVARDFAKTKAKRRTPEWRARVDQRQEVIALTRGHVAHLERQQARRDAAEPRADSAAALFDGARDSPSGSASDALPAARGAETVEDLSEGIAVIHAQERRIDEQLDRLEELVGTVKQQALGFRDNLAVQDAILQDVATNMQAVDDEVVAQTGRMEDLVERMGGTNRTIFRVVLLLLLLAFVGLGINLAI